MGEPPLSPAPPVQNDIPLTGFTTFGLVNAITAGYLLTEGNQANSGITLTNYAMPVGAQSVSCRFQFTGAGDGDYLEVSHGDTVIGYGSDNNTSLTNPVKADSDGDGANDGSELAAGTDPLNGTSRFAVKSSVRAGVNFTITWSSVAAKHYRIIRSTEPGFDTYDVVVSGVLAAPPQQSYTDVGGATASRLFYRVELEP